MPSLTPAFVRLVHLLAMAASLLLLVPSVSAEGPGSDGFRFLGIPIVGTIGADQTPEGVEQALALARSEGLDGVVIEIDARTGDLDDGVAIAGLIAAAAADLRTVAVIHRAGGAALPIAFACEDWVVLEETTVEGRDERGERTLTALGSDRVALQALPARANDLDALRATLAATRAACRRMVPGTLDEPVRKARRTLAEALTDPTRDLLVADTSEVVDPAGGLGRGVAGLGLAPVMRPPAHLGDAMIVPTADLGPGITARQLPQTTLASLAFIGLEPLAEALGVDSCKAFGDAGAALVASNADDRASARASLGSRIDALFSALDGAGTLAQGMPWTLARARLSNPDEIRRSGRLPMVHADGAWRIAPEAIDFWTRFCDDSIRRWSGVIELADTVDELLDRAATIRGELAGVEPDAADVQRLADALAISDSRLESIRAARTGFDVLEAEAEQAVARLGKWRETPPVLPTEALATSDPGSN